MGGGGCVGAIMRGRARGRRIGKMDEKMVSNYILMNLIVHYIL